MIHNEGRKQWKFRRGNGVYAGNLQLEYGITVDDEVEEDKEQWIRQL